MVKRSLCRKCWHWRRYGGWLGPHCGYLTDTGKCRLTQMTPEQRRSGECPVFEAGKPKRVIVKPFIEGSCRLARLTEGPPMYVAPKYKLDQEKLRALYDRGLTDREIAEEMGCARDSVRLWRKRTELPPNGNKAKRRVDWDAVRALYMAGMTDREIAEATGHHRQSIGDWRRTEGLPCNIDRKKEEAK